MGFACEVVYERKIKPAMKKKIFLFIVIISGLVLASFKFEATHIRDDFHQAVKSESKLQTLIVSKSYPNNYVTKAYKGLAKCTSADFATWPTTKWKYFTEGKALIETAILGDQTNPEIRYVRLMVQLNAPGIVNYSDNIYTDLEIFEENITAYSLDVSWKTSFIDKLISAGALSSKQVTQLTTLKESLLK